MTFQREARYVVFKLKDLKKYVPDSVMRVLKRIGATIDAGRKMDGRGTFNAVVVEQDWPEFDQVWRMIEQRVRRQGYDRIDDMIAATPSAQIRRTVNDVIEGFLHPAPAPEEALTRPFTASEVAAQQSRTMRFMYTSSAPLRITVERGRHRQQVEIMQEMIDDMTTLSSEAYVRDRVFAMIRAVNEEGRHRGF